MPNKRFSFLIGQSAVAAKVEADQEGNARFMVRLTIPTRLVRVRIGYLTGARRTWCAELFGRPARSVRPPALRPLACSSPKKLSNSRPFSGTSRHS